MRDLLACSIVVVSCALPVACGRSHAPALGDAGGSGTAGSEGGAGGEGGGGGAAGVAGAAGAASPDDGGSAVDARFPGEPRPVTPSAGCGIPPTQALAQYVRYDVTVPDVAAAYAATDTNRIYWVRIPKTYDPARAYPTVFLGPGCGDSGQTPIPMQSATLEDAILVGMNGGVANCFNHDAADTPDLPYFDETLKQVEASFCVDTSRLFVAGFSSGSWLTSYLGCARADVIRAQASVAGGLPPVPACGGPIPAMYVADTDDMKNPVATVLLARDRVRAVNGCGDETEPYDFGVPSPCVQYKGCMPGYPVVWCVTSGVGHADQSSTKISTVGFWHFWTSLP